MIKGTHTHKGEHVPQLLLAAIILGCTVALSAYAADGEIPAVYGPSNIGSLENGAVTIEREENRPGGSRGIEAVSPCATTFSGPSAFAFPGTTNLVTASDTPVSAGATFAGCLYSATSDAAWLTVTPGTASTVTYTVAINTTSIPLVGHIRVIGAGFVFALTVTVGTYNDAQHSTDFFGDNHDQLTVWRPSSGVWYVKNTVTAETISQQWGLPGDKPVLGDFDNDGIADFAVWRPSNGTWYILPSSNPSTPITQQFGLNGDIALPADYDGDGKTDIAVFRPSNQTWYIINSSTHATATQKFGMSGDIPIPGDYDGDGKKDLTVFRPSTGTWYFLGSLDGVVHSQQLGLPNDIPIPQSHVLEGILDVWRPSNGQFYFAAFGSPTDSYQLGLSGDVPAVLTQQGRFVVWRPSNGTWYIAERNPVQWGLNGDVLPGAPHTATQ